MKMLNLPHQTADYLCPINGICDIFEWKTGKRIDDRLLFGCQIGFQMISNKSCNPPKMIFLGSGIGKRQYEFLQSIMNYKIYFSEKKSFKNTINSAKGLVNEGIPVILFGLDMYYLSYLEKFYKKMHIPGHIILMVGYDEKNIYIHDNSKEGIQKLEYENLENAWKEDYVGVSKRNTYFGIEFNNTNMNYVEVLKNGYKKIADNFLNPKVSFMGKKGYDRLINEIEIWNQVYSKEQLTQIFKNFIMFTASVIPEVPKEIDENSVGVNNSYKGGRELIKNKLQELGNEYNIKNSSELIKCLEKSASQIEKIEKEMVNDVKRQEFKDIIKYKKLFSELKEAEVNIYELLKMC